MRIRGVTVTIVVETDDLPLETKIEINGLVVENDIRGPGVAIAGELILPLHNIEKMIEQKRAEG